MGKSMEKDDKKSESTFSQYRVSEVKEFYVEATSKEKQDYIKTDEKKNIMDFEE